MPPFPPYCTYLVPDTDQIWQKLVALCVGWDGGVVGELELASDGDAVMLPS